MRWGALAVLVVVLIAGSCAGVLADPSPSPDPVDVAQALFNDHKYRDAITLLDRYLGTKPADAEAFTLRGDAKAQLGDNTGALADYNQAIVLAPEYAYAYQTRCETRADLNNDAGALDDCNMAIKLDPKRSRAYIDRADIFYDQENYVQAIADYDRAERLGATTPYLYASRCQAKTSMNAYAAAAPDCSKAMLLDPKDHNALWASGLLALQTGHFTETIADFNSYRIVVTDEKIRTSALLWRAVAYNRVGNWQGALDDLDAYIPLNDDVARGYSERAFARANLGDLVRATADMTQALRLYRIANDTKRVDELTPFLTALRAGGALPALPAP